MPRAPLRSVLDHLRHALAPPDTAGVTDAQLLERFVRQGDEAAFELLVRRHQRLVHGVCRRVLRDAQGAEDAFQATFLALVRKAGSVRRGGSVAGWLYQVAYRTALRAGSTAARRARRERQGVGVQAAVSPRDPTAEAAARELLSLLDAELNRLAGKYRDPVVLCYLEGKTYDEAARQLGCAKGTVATRLAHARELLRQRLSVRGLGLAGGVLAAGLGGSLAPAAPARLLGATLAAARPAAPGQAGAAPHVVALTEGVLRTMWLTKVTRAAAVVLLALGVLGLGTASLARPGPAGEPPSPPGPEAPLSVAGAEQVGEVYCLRGHTDRVLRVEFSPDGRRLLSCGMDATIRLWDLHTGRDIRRFQGHGDRVDCVSFSADGRRFLSASWDWTIRLWDVESGKELKRIRFRGEPGVHVSGVWWFPDGRRCLALATDHSALQVYDVRTGRLLKNFGQHPGHIYAAALSPDGGQVLEGSYDVVAPLRLWDVSSGGLVREFKGQACKTIGVAFSPDGRLALSTGTDNRVRLWDVTTGKVVRVFEGHANGANAVAYSPDGRRALSAGADHTVRLWDAATGAERVRFFGHLAGVDCVAFSADGRYAASGGQDKAVRVWRLPAPLGPPLKRRATAAEGSAWPEGGSPRGEREWRLAEFYGRTGHPGSAYFYYELLLRRHPESPYAQRASERLRALRRELEKAAGELDPPGGRTK
jgi:RNA polymerase sigma factor (sigma-70 family)